MKCGRKSAGGCELGEWVVRAVRVQTREVRQVRTTTENFPTFTFQHFHKYRTEENSQSHKLKEAANISKNDRKFVTLS